MSVCVCVRVCVRARVLCHHTIDESVWNRYIHTVRNNLRNIC